MTLKKIIVPDCFAQALFVQMAGVAGVSAVACREQALCLVVIDVDHERFDSLFDEYETRLESLFRVAMSFVETLAQQYQGTLHQAGCSASTAGSN